EDSRRDREANILASGGSAAGHLVRIEEGRRERKEARRVRPADGGARLHGAPGSPAGRVVYARETGRLKSRDDDHAYRRQAPQSRQQEPGKPATVLAARQGAGSGRGQEDVKGPRHQGYPGRRRDQHSARRDEGAALASSRRHSGHGASRQQEVP